MFKSWPLDVAECAKRKVGRKGEPAFWFSFKHLKNLILHKTQMHLNFVHLSQLQIYHEKISKCSGLAMYCILSFIYISSTGKRISVFQEFNYIIYLNQKFRGPFGTSPILLSQGHNRHLQVVPDCKKNPIEIWHNICHQASNDCNHQCLRAIRVGPVDDVEGVAFTEEVFLVQRLRCQVWRENR